MRDLQEERAMNKSLLENQSVWQHQITELENRVKEMNEQKDKVSLKANLLSLLFLILSTFNKYKFDMILIEPLLHPPPSLMSYKLNSDCKILWN